MIGPSVLCATGTKMGEGRMTKSHEQTPVLEKKEQNNKNIVSISGLHLPGESGTNV